MPKLVDDCSYEQAELHCTEVPRMLYSKGDVSSLEDYVNHKCEPYVDVNCYFCITVDFVTPS